jgi:cation transport protein ChaC
LITDAGASCEGLAFEVPDAQRDAVVAYLKSREGPSFALEEQDVELQDGTRIRALVPMSDASKTTYIGGLPLQDRARMTKDARGYNGQCRDYVKNLRDKLQELHINDSAVASFWSVVSSE